MFVFKSSTPKDAATSDASVARTAALFFGFLAALRLTPFIIARLRPSA